MLKKPWLLGMSMLGALMLMQLGLVAADREKEPKVDLSKVPAASDKKGLTFAKDVQPILGKSCVKCHSGDRPKSKYLMDNRADVIKGGKSGDPAVVPGQSLKSPLVLYPSDAVEEMEMPPTEKRDKYPALTKEQIGILRAWIDQGAK